MSLDRYVEAIIKNLTTTEACFFAPQKKNLINSLTPVFPAPSRYGVQYA